MARRPLRRRRPPRIDDDQLAAVALLRLEVPHDRRHRLGDVAADEQDDVRVRDVGERKRQPAIDAERLDGGGRRRRHAEAAVVVDVRRAERDARELAEPVRLLVGQRAAAEHADRVAPCCRCTSPKRVAIARERRVPRRRHETSRIVAHQRRAQAIGMTSVAAADQPLTHRPPSLTGNFGVAARPSTPPGASTRCMPHCSAQYGQCVATAGRQHVHRR